MTKHTDRDKIWSAALAIAEEDMEKNPYRLDDEMTAREFSAEDVEKKLDVDPSRRTVRDVLQTMRDLGHLENTTTVGAKKAGEYRRPD